MLNPAGQREEALQVIGDVAFDLLRRHAGVERGHSDYRDVHGREQIHGHAQNRHATQDRDNHADHNNQVRRLDREAGHYLPPSTDNLGSTTWPSFNPARRPTMTSAPSSMPETISTSPLPSRPVFTDAMWTRLSVERK